MPSGPGFLPSTVLPLRDCGKLPAWSSWWISPAVLFLPRRWLLNKTQMVMMQVLIACIQNHCKIGPAFSESLKETGEILMLLNEMHLPAAFQSLPLCRARRDSVTLLRWSSTFFAQMIYMMSIFSLPIARVKLWSLINSLPRPNDGSHQKCMARKPTRNGAKTLQIMG